MHDELGFTTARPSASAPTPGSGAAAPRTGVLLGGLVALVLVKAAYYAHLGAGLFLDDWRLVSNTQVYGTFASLHGDHDLVSRPVAWVWFNVVYAVAGDHPGRLLLAVTALNVVLVALLFLVLRKVWSPAIAAAIAAVWVLLPSHTSLTVWGGVVQALLAMILVLAGLLALSAGRWIPVALCFAAAALCYQVVIPVALLAALVFPSEHGIALVDRAKVAGATLLALGWVALHPTYPTSFQVPDVLRLWRAHFGTGLFASEAPPVALRTAIAIAVLVAVVACLVAGWRGARDVDDGPFLVLVGVAVWLLGLAVLASTPQWVQDGEFGITDRVFGVSSLGAALMFVGIGVFLWRRRRVAAVAVGVVLFGLCAWGQYVALDAWSAAGRDAAAMLDRLGALSDIPNRTTYLVGPGYPVRDNVRSLEADSVYYAHKLWYPPGNSGTVHFFDDPFTPRTEGQVLVPWSTVSNDLPDAFYEPIVRIDPLSVTAAGLHVSGVAVDRSRRHPIPIRVYLDGGRHPVAEGLADLPRDDVDALYGLGDHHGYDVRVHRDLAAGTHTVCVRGIGRRPDAAMPPRVECLDVTVPPDHAPVGPDAADLSPLGAVDAATATPAGIHVQGWILDRATTAPVSAEVTLDGVAYGTLDPAGGDRPDLEVYGFGAQHGFDAEVAGPAVPAGTHDLCIWPAGAALQGAPLDCLSFEALGG